jgi:hypothetical protein
MGQGLLPGSLIQVPGLGLGPARRTGEGFQDLQPLLPHLLFSQGQSCVFDFLKLADDPVRRLINVNGHLGVFILGQLLD